MSSAPIYNPVIPFIGFVPGGALQVNQLIKISGTVHPQPNCFSINLQLGPKVNPRDDIALHLSPVFMPPARVVRNHLQNQCWGAEEGYGEFPFAPGQKFEVSILVDVKEYKIFINGYPFADFKHRVPFGYVSNLTIDGDVSISQILYEQASPTSMPFSSNAYSSGSALPYPTGLDGKVPPMIPNPSNQAFSSYPSQSYPSQAYPSTAYAQQSYSSPTYPKQNFSSQAYQPQAYPQQAYPQQTYPQQAYPQQAYPQQAYSQQAYPQQAYPQQGNYIPPIGVGSKPYKKKGLFSGIPGGMTTGLAGAAAGAAIGASLMPKFKVKKMFKHKFKGPKFLKHKGFMHKGFGFGKRKGWGKFKHKGWGYDSD